MKKLLLLLLAICTCFLLCIVQTSCHNNDKDDSHNSLNHSTTDSSNIQDKNPSNYKQNNIHSVSQGLEYQKQHNEIIITGLGTCKDIDLIIPQQIEGVPVTAIDSNAFESSNLVSISIPETITYIGTDAFAYCTELKKVHINNLSAWCEISFEENGHTPHSNPLCNGADLYLNGKIVREIVIPEGIKSIKQYAFHGCKSLVSVIITDSVETISMGAFSECLNLRSVTLGTNVKNIFYRAWNETERPFNCYVTEIINHSSLDIIEESSDYGDLAKHAKIIHTGESKLVNYGDYVFFSYRNTTYLTNYFGDELFLVLPDGYNGNTYAIASGALHSDNIISLTIPQSVISIDYNAISSNKLVEIINNSALQIGKNIFTLESNYPIEIHSGSTRLINHNGYILYTNSSDTTYLVNYTGDKPSIVLDKKIVNKEYRIEYVFLNSTKNHIIYYTGTFDEWKRICNYANEKNIYYYSEVEPTDFKKYWHYVDGVPTIWK